MSDQEPSPAPAHGRCIYGFVLYIISNSLLILFLISLLPEYLLDKLELSGLPSKYWYISLSSLVFVGIFAFGLFVYPIIVYSLTENKDSVSLFHDQFSCYIQDLPPVVGDTDDVEIPPAYDVPLENMSRQLYLDKTVRMDVKQRTD